MTHHRIANETTFTSTEQEARHHTSSWVAEQLAQHAIHLSAHDLEQTAMHYQLLCEHAANVTGFPLPEAIEPAPEFSPLTFEYK